MRISSKSSFIPYERNLQQIQERRFKNEIRLSTGKDIVNLGDAPEKIQDVKNLTNIVESNERFINIVDSAVNELYAVEETLVSISDRVRQLRDLSIDAAQTGNTGGLESLAQFVKGIMEDIVNVGNTDFNGKLLFSGTKTSPNSITPTGDQQNSMPFEFIEGEPTADNPSGFRVEFKGNFEDRIINKDQRTDEVINVKANEIFGEGGTEIFDTINELYNLMKFDSEGNLRGFYSTFNVNDMGKLNELQQKLGEFDNEISQTLGINGTKYSRLDNQSIQMTYENTRIKEYLSLKEDTDIAKRTLDLRLEETSLQYSLQIGQRLLSTTLFDFLR